MNGQPPPLPQSPPPAPFPPQQVHVPRQGMGCCAIGCVTILILGMLLFAGLAGSTWYFYTKTLVHLTSTEPADVRMEQPSEAQIQAAEDSRARLDRAIANKEEITVEFSGADLTALLARDADFKELGGRTRVDIVDSKIAMVLSVPLDDTGWRKLRGRWFNGSVRFGFAYLSGRFRIDLESLEIGGHRLPGKFLSNTFMDALNDGLNDAIRDNLSEHDLAEDFWRQVKSISVVGDKMVVTTKAE